MLYLNPPFPVIDGVSFFSDHQDPLQFYYLPLAPHLTVLKDHSGESIPQISLIKYRGDAGNGGFLNFDCNIGIEPDRLDDLGAQLKREMKLKDKPRLSPVPIVDGAVRMMLFGVETSDPAPVKAGSGSGSSGGTATATLPTLISTAGTRFVTKIDQAAKPALYGDNQAAFSVALDQDGIVVLEAALKGELSPIGIVYELQFLGLRPAYKVHLSIDWDRVQKRMDEEYKVDVLFFSADIDKTVDELIEKRVIELDVDTFVPEGGDDTSTLSRRDQAVNEVREMITDAFFKPSVDPAADPKDGWDKATAAADRISQLAVTGGLASFSAFGYKKLDYTRIDKKSLDVTFSERTTVKRTIYPQGHLSGLLSILQGKDPSKYTIDVDLNDPWFQKRRVTAISRADYDDDAISSLDVRLNYANTPRNTLLTAQSAPASLEWPSDVAGGVMQRSVESQYTVNFKNVDDLERPQSVVSPKTSIDVEFLEIKPRDLYSIVHVPVVALDVPWDRYPRVQVDLAYDDAASGIKYRRKLMFTSDKPEQTERLFVLDRTKSSFAYAVTYHAVDGHDIALPAVTTDDPQIFLRDPFPSKRTVDVVCVVDWGRVANVFVDLAYDDATNNVSAESSVQFGPTDTASKQFSVELQDPTRRLVSYDVTIVFKDNRMLQIPKSYTLDRRIFVRSTMNGHRIVQLRPANGDFAAAQIKQIAVQTRYVDQASGLNYAGSAIFTSPKDRATFEFDYIDPQKTHYEYSTTTLFANGLSTSSDWLPSGADELVVPLGRS